MSTAISSPAFEKMHLTHLPETLRLSCQRLAAEKGRLHVVDARGTCLCVLISKSELESLEQALAVLSDDDEVRAMSKSLARVAAAVEPQIARSHQCAGAVDGAAVGAVAGATTGRGRANSRN